MSGPLARLRLPLGPWLALIRARDRDLLAPLRGPLPGWAPPPVSDRRAAAAAPSVSVDLRRDPRPTAAAATTLTLVRRPAAATTVHGESPLWRLALDPVSARAHVRLAPAPPPYRPGDGVRSALQTVLTLLLAWRGGGSLHGAVVVRDGLGVVALGASGAGKSTFARRFPWDRVLADDLVALTRDRRGFVAHGTPFRGREGDVGALGRTRVGVVALLAQRPRTAATPLVPAAAVGPIAARIHAPAPLRALRERALSLALDLAETVPCVRLAVALEEDPWPSLLAASQRR